MNQLFRIVALLEGVSYLLLMYFAYISRDEGMIKLLGMPHGILFMVYVILAFMIRSDYKWKSRTFAVVLIASVIPFGAFYVDKKYLKKK